MSVQVRWLICYGPLPVFCFYGFEAAVSAPSGRVANASFLASKLQLRHRVDGFANAPLGKTIRGRRHGR